MIYFSSFFKFWNSFNWSVKFILGHGSQSNDEQQELITIYLFQLRERWKFLLFNNTFLFEFRNWFNWFIKFIPTIRHGSQSNEEQQELITIYLFQFREQWKFLLFNDTFPFEFRNWFNWSIKFTPITKHGSQQELITIYLFQLCERWKFLLFNDTFLVFLRISKLI